jgi:hypothetical protein
MLNGIVNIYTNLFSCIYFMLRKKSSKNFLFSIIFGFIHIHPCEYVSEGGWGDAKNINEAYQRTRREIPYQNNDE